VRNRQRFWLPSWCGLTFHGDRVCSYLEPNHQADLSVQFPTVWNQTAGLKAYCLGSYQLRYPLANNLPVHQLRPRQRGQLQVFLRVEPTDDSQGGGIVVGLRPQVAPEPDVPDGVRVQALVFAHLQCRPPVQLVVQHKLNPHPQRSQVVIR
jgi:hypothetical protein